MLDDDDLDFAILASGGGGGGWLSFLLGLAVVIAVACAVSDNHRECEQKHCDRGTPVLTAHECLCVERAK